MDAHYDSDDDFSWGPVTPREIKRYLKDRAAEGVIIDRRRTIGFNSPPRQSFDENPLHSLDKLAEDVSKISIQSEYFTPDETKNDLVSNATSFATALDGNLTKISENVDSDLLVDNFRATLLETTESSEDECMKSTLKNIIEKLNDDLDEGEAFVNAAFDDSVIVVSDSDSDKELSRYTGVQSIYEDISGYEDETYHTIDECKHEKPRESIYDFDSDDSTIEPSSLILNDTMEEMKRALEEGLNYSMPDNKQLKKPVCKLPIYSPFKVKNTIPSRLKPPTTFNNIISPVSNYINKPSPREFKIPKQPTKKYQSPLPKPKTPSSLSFHNIKSPVSLYIKNSTTTLQKNVPQTSLPRLIPKKILSPIENKSEFKGKLASVVYKPARKNLLGKDDGPRLPGSIQKYVPLNTNIIKHEGRVVHHLKGRSVEQKLLADDLTVNSTCLLEDVSMITSRKAVIE